MPDPIKKQIADKLIALLEAWPAFFTAVMENKTGRVGNQATDGWLRDRIARAPNDFPKLTPFTGRCTSSGYTQPAVTFAGEGYAGTEPHGALILDRTFQMKLKMTARDLKSTSIEPMEEAAEIAILQGGRHLGLAFVRTWGPIVFDRYEVDSQGRRTIQGQRLETEVTINVSTQHDGNDILV